MTSFIVTALKDPGVYNCTKNKDEKTKYVYSNTGTVKIARFSSQRMYITVLNAMFVLRDSTITAPGLLNVWAEVI